MTTHVKLTEGELRPFTTDGNVGERLENISGRLDCIINNLDTRSTCFVLQSGADWTRLYLDLDRRPASRLLLLLCSALDYLRDGVVTVASDNTHGEGKSRLTASITNPDGTGTETFAPFDLPRGYAELNGERLNLIKTALGNVVETEAESGTTENPSEPGTSQEPPQESGGTPAAGDTVAVTVEELGHETPHVIEGMGPAETVPVESRRAVVVKGHPRAVVVYSAPCEYGSYEELLRAGVRHTVIHDVFKTESAAEAFVKGSQRTAQWGSLHTIVAKGSEEVNAVLSAFMNPTA